MMILVIFVCPWRFCAQALLIVVAPYRWFHASNPSVHLERALLSGADLHKLQTLQEEETHPYTRTHLHTSRIPTISCTEFRPLSSPRFFFWSELSRSSSLSHLSWFFWPAMLIFVSPMCHKIVNLLIGWHWVTLIALSVNFVSVIM